MFAVKLFGRKILKRILPLRFLRAFLKFPSEKQIINNVRALQENYGDKIIIFPSPGTPWGYMFQRPQQLALQFARKGYCVLYCVDKNFVENPDWLVRGMFEIQKNLYLFDDGQFGNTLINVLESPILFTYWPQQYDYAKKIYKKAIWIADCIDDVSNFGNKEALIENYDETIRLSDIQIATATKIQESIFDKHGILAELINNGVNCQDFEQKLINNNSKTISEKSVVGYYGAIASWFDFELMDFLISNNPEINFMVAGQVYPDVIDDFNELTKNDNFRYLGRLPYSEIPKLLSDFDVGIIPFKLNEITLSTNPVKVYEYMAGGKITVATELPELRSLPYVMTASNSKLFNELLNEVIVDARANPTGTKIREASKKYSWENKAEQIIELIESKRNASVSKGVKV